MFYSMYGALGSSVLNRVLPCNFPRNLDNQTRSWQLGRQLKCPRLVTISFQASVSGRIDQRPLQVRECRVVPDRPRLPTQDASLEFDGHEHVVRHVVLGSDAEARRRDEAEARIVGGLF